MKKPNYNLICDLIDSFNEDYFILWYLLPKYREELEKRLEEAVKTSGTAYEIMGLKESIQVIDAMRLDLSDTLW